MNTNTFEAVYTVLRKIEAEHINTLSNLKTSELHDEWFLATFSFSKQFVSKTNNFQKTHRLNNSLGLDYEDNQHNYCLALYSKFDAIIKAYKKIVEESDLINEQDICTNITKYCIRIIQNYQIDSYRRISNTLTIDQQEHKKIITKETVTVLALKDIYNQISLDQEVQNLNGDKTSLLNTITSNEIGAENQVIISEKIMSYLNKLTPLEMLGFISESLGYKNKELCHLLLNMSKKDTFNALIKTFIETYNCNEALMYLNRFNEDDFNYTGKMSIESLISHMRSQAKTKNNYKSK